MDREIDHVPSICRVVMDNLDVAIYVADLQTSKLLYLNRYAKDRWGDDYRNIRCTDHLRAIGADACPFCNTDTLVDSAGKPTGIYRWEFEDPSTGAWFDCRDGAIIWPDGRLVHLEIAVDITERKLWEKRMQASLQEKDVLLREIHHRVKNNLQVVASLLSLQAMQASSPETVDALRESGRRIQLMAQIHNRLYRSPNLADVQFDVFVRELAEDIVLSCGLDPERVKLRTRLRPITLNIDQAIACSQIVNELMSNSVKHAFPADRKGTIAISMSQDERGIVLWIEDDGVGMPEGLDRRENDTLGLKVVEALTRQLDGRIDLFRENGTRYRISF